MDSTEFAGNYVSIGARVPRGHHPLLQWLGLRLLRLAGWRLDVQLPDEPKLVVIGAPHTSNWDGYYGVLAICAMGLRLNVFAKHSMFWPPLGSLLRHVGFIPLDRTAPGGVVAQTVEAFRTHPQLLIGLAPEGTRGRVEKWKRGFHLMAQGAQVPIVCAYLDYARKVVGTGLVLMPSPDYAADLERIQAFYRTITPRHPENFAACG
jgi:1-acyl-sn-glycerol-3-phosphate acyltransferase